MVRTPPPPKRGDGAFFHVGTRGELEEKGERLRRAVCCGVVYRGIEIPLLGYWCEARFIRSFIAAPTPELGMPIAMIVVRFSWSRRRIAAKRLIPACRNPADESSVARISSFAIQLF